MSRDTQLVRIKKSLAQELKYKFPNVPLSSAIQMSYDTSLLKVEGILEEKDFTNKFGRLLYGNAWQKKKQKRKLI